MSEVKYIRRRITITFTSFEQDVGVSDEDLAAALNHQLQDWYEGRYNFEVEMMKDGLGRLMRHAVSRVVLKRRQDELGNAMIPCELGGLKGQMSAAYAKSGEDMRDFSATIGIIDNRDDPVGVSVATESDEEE